VVYKKLNNRKKSLRALKEAVASSTVNGSLNDGV